jgi:hypothetical protein
MSTAESATCPSNLSVAAMVALKAQRILVAVQQVRRREIARC